VYTTDSGNTIEELKERQRRAKEGNKRGKKKRMGKAESMRILVSDYIELQKGHYRMILCFTGLFY